MGDLSNDSGNAGSAVVDRGFTLMTFLGRSTLEGLPSLSAELCNRSFRGIGSNEPLDILQKPLPFASCPSVPVYEFH